MHRLFTICENSEEVAGPAVISPLTSKNVGWEYCLNSSGISNPTVTGICLHLNVTVAGLKMKQDLVKGNDLLRLCIDVIS